ncbi:hypothetical protein ACFFMN_23900 [Planobispora siamensis]|uniref:Uncharacterized protein n=1 Tax=Planobispora siamensis TaxID=936338 RepID=A0A8J3SIZ4_9ACTN|nr:hypothetical protein [Planobispora siamensis]GIH95381.1 hypothetical protein Psi01_60110 [Planobispora siamensis]
MTTPIAPWCAPTVDIQPLPTFGWFDHTGYGGYSEHMDLRRAKEDGWYGLVVLDTGTGQLSIRANRGYGPHFKNGHPPDEHYAPEQDLWYGRRYHRTPRRLGAFLREGLTREEVEQVLAQVAPAAQRLLQHLEPLPDGGWDWTVEAATTYQALRLFVSHPQDRTLESTLTDLSRHPSTVAFDTVIEAIPSIVDPAWTVASDAELDRIAEAFCQGNGYYSSNSHGRSPYDLLTEYAKLAQPDSRHVPSAPTVVGARAALRRWRAAAIQAQTGYPAQPAAAWFAAHQADAPDVTADLDDAQLAELAEVTIATVAHDHHISLVGVADYLTDERARLRDLVRAEATVMGQRTNALLAEADRARTARAAMAARIASWNDPKERGEDGDVNGAEIGRLVGMTRQGVHKLLERLRAEDPDGEENADT